MTKDFKNSFYRTLQLDKETQQILKWYRKISKELLNEPEEKKTDKKEEQ